MTTLWCEKEPVRPDHMNYDYMTALQSHECDVLVIM